MTVLPRCPECGFESPEIRCPRCNALKVVGCSGACTLCREQCETDSCAQPTSSGPPLESP